MIDRQALLSDLQTLLARLEADLLERSESAEVPDVGRTLRAEYQRAKQAERTAANYEDWRSDAITQAAAAWVLSSVFVRFLEDNHLIEPPKLSGQSTAVAGQQNRLQRARDEHELFFRAHPKLTDRDYLLAVFDELAVLPGIHEVFGEHNPIRELPSWLSGDAGGELLRFFQRIDANTGVLVHDFTDQAWDTRFLGDLYQDLSEAARKKYALLQTPEFVEEFILERTLEPALNQFGLDDFRMIDPACGSGHFLLGSFRHILARWQKQAPETNGRELVQRTLDSVHGVDVNPYAVAIARFRLLLVAMKPCGVTRLADAPAFHFNLVCGDSLLHGGAGGDQIVFGFHELAHAYRSEDLTELRRILRPGTYHAVVANPPYITPKDKALNRAYRERYSACHMKYSLAVPFMQRLFDLATSGQEIMPSKQQSAVRQPEADSGSLICEDAGAAGYVGQITANSFMKREFGKKLIEQVLPRVDLTHVIDTSGAYIPGCGTPTVILLGRKRAPARGDLRTVMGIRGEPSTPNDPARGLVWSAIISQVDQPGSQTEFVSVADSSRELFHKHPWSIGGGGAATLKEFLDCANRPRLRQLQATHGFAVVIGETDAFQGPEASLARKGVPRSLRQKLVQGDGIRDWVITDSDCVLYPYTNEVQLACEDLIRPYLWYYRTTLLNRPDFSGVTYRECGRTYWEYHQISRQANTTLCSICYAGITTHNHFSINVSRRVFRETAPVITLNLPVAFEDYVGIVGLLNSSTCAFWLRQVCFPKGGSGINCGIKDEAWEQRFAFNAANVGGFPLPDNRPIELTGRLNCLTKCLIASSPAAITGDCLDKDRTSGGGLAAQFDNHANAWQTARSRMISLQEELDWKCYPLYGLLKEDLTLSAEPPPIQLGQRAFEIVMARKMAAEELETEWFKRHGSTPITEIPGEWPEDYKRLVDRRIEMIESNPNVGLIEQPEYKRRWNTESWKSQLERALREWLLDRMESCLDFDGRLNSDGKPTAKLDVALISVGRLADVVRQDSDFMKVGEVYRDDTAFSVDRLVAELIEAESVPLLPILRYKPSGLRKRAEWEQTWELQREEDRTGRRLDIPVPPKYTSADFLKSDFWRLRGKLDVPKERWISFPQCEGPDGTLVIAWAGYDHLQLARSISAYFVDIQEHLGGRNDPRLVPLLACLLELIPWLKQWHNEVDPEFGERMGDYFEGFVNEEARQLGKTIPEIKAWQPEARTKVRGKKAR